MWWLFSFSLWCARMTMTNMLMTNILTRRGLTPPFCNISEEKNIYIYFVFFEIFYILSVFVHYAEWGSFAWFPGGFFCFFLEGGRGGAPWRFAQGSVETVHFLGISSLRNWVKQFLYFENCLSLFICLPIYYYYYYYYFGWR